MFAVDGTPSVRLAGRLSGLARSSAGSETFGGVDGWVTDAVEADGFSAEAPAAARKEVDTAAAARAVQHAADITGVDGFEIEPAVKARLQRSDVARLLLQHGVAVLVVGAEKRLAGGAHPTPAIPDARLSRASTGRLATTTMGKAKAAAGAEPAKKKAKARAAAASASATSSSGDGESADSGEDTATPEEVSPPKVNQGEGEQKVRAFACVRGRCRHNAKATTPWTLPSAAPRASRASAPLLHR
jgi:hypothetical protein